MLRDPTFFRRPNNIASRGRGGREESVGYEVQKKCPQICNFLNSFVQDCRCVCEIKNKDSLCCARAIVVMREYAKRQAGEHNTFENIHKGRGKNSQQLKEAKRLHDEACS